ncbi:GtrA family protein [Massilia sp. MB5]|uniref:GtrA family protein n=1 Tax=Massilia sp. MB5 TaxID=2919578 RepID=UPI001F112E66|nr:GtrA family protein [Massilia sp. MB5]UMR31023.1 GtrA family protein [Massilia sp. MB5]
MKALLALLQRYRQVLLFAAIGAVNTVIHAGSVVALVELGRWHPVAANIGGFCAANLASYFANSRFTFRQRASWARYGKFLAVSLLSLALTVALSALAAALHWHYLAGLGLVILCGPVLTYLLHRRLTFRRSARH